MNFKKSRKITIPDKPPAWSVWYCKHKWYKKKKATTYNVAEFRCSECGGEWLTNIINSYPHQYSGLGRKGGFYTKPSWLEKLTHGMPN